jgi:hypothetical protein
MFGNVPIACSQAEFHPLTKDSVCLKSMKDKDLPEIHRTSSFHRESAHYHSVNIISFEPLLFVPFFLICLRLHQRTLENDNQTIN